MKKVFYLIGLSLLIFGCKDDDKQKGMIIQDSVLPRISIVTEGKKEILSKENYIRVTISVEGLGSYKDYSGSGKIRGRGNNTWGKPKKPYKIKLDKKVGLLGMLPEKDWVLLANYNDETLMLTAAAMKIGQQLNIDYVNHIVPVDVTINGEFRGQYNLTENVEVKKNRLNVKKGILLELDNNFDRKHKFMSLGYNLPVNFKYPKKVSSVLFESVKEDINTLETLMKSPNFPNNGYGDYIDKDAFASYYLTNMLTGNSEIKLPRSLFMHRKKGSKKFIMGPLWDFDWGFGYNKSSHFNSYSYSIVSGDKPGAIFLSRLLSDPEIASLIKQKWNVYKTNDFPYLLTYLYKYHENQKMSRLKDYQKWSTGIGDYDSDYYKLRTWLENRATYIDTYTENL